MKKLTLLALLSCLVITASWAQESPIKAYKAAMKSVNDATGAVDKTKLKEAIKKIDYAVSNIGDLDAKFHTKAWAKRGDLYINAATMAATLPDMRAEYQDAGLKAFESYNNVLSNGAVKKWEISSAKSGLEDCLNALLNDGDYAYKAKDYGKAFDNFMATIKAQDVLVKGGSERALKEDAMTDIYQFTGVSALLANRMEDAQKAYEMMLDKKVNKPFVYDGLFNAYKGSDEAKAFEFLKEGRAAHPDDKGLLFSQINYYLSKGELDKLEDDLKLAIKTDPENKTLYITLANVYDQLMQQKVEDLKNAEGQEATALTAEVDKYYSSAANYYQQALDKDAKYFEALYSLGALHFNKAVNIFNVRNQLKLSEEKKYAELTEEATAYAKKSFPLFVEAEKVNATDISLLNAFRQLYTLAGDFVASKEYKTRLEKVQADAKTTLEPYAHPSIDKIKVN